MIIDELAQPGDQFTCPSGLEIPLQLDSPQHEPIPAFSHPDNLVHRHECTANSELVRELLKLLPLRRRRLGNLDFVLGRVNIEIRLPRRQAGRRGVANVEAHDGDEIARHVVRETARLGGVVEQS